MRGMRLAIVVLIGLAGFGSTAQDVAPEVIFIGDQHESPLEAVQVFDDKLKFLEVSDASGHVTLPDLPDDTFLNFTYIGYTTQRHSVGYLKQNGVVTMRHTLHQLEEIEVVGRYGHSRQDISQQLEIVERTEISFTNPQTTADAIDQHTGAFVQRSQMGGGSPIIRGFEANKILLVVDGVRLNNAIYRNGHLQNSITVGSSTLERIEVLYGPGSLEYGSDAIGGVMNFRTRNPRLSTAGQNTVHGGAMIRYSTANKEMTGQADFEIGGKKLASLTSFSYSDFGDLRMGSRRDDRFPDYGKRPDYQDFIGGRDTLLANPDPDVQIGTAYSQYDILQKLIYRPNSKLQFTGNFQYSSSSDVPRYDNLTERDDAGDLRWAEWYYGPQRRLLASVKANWFGTTAIFDNVQLIVAYQDIDEDRITRQFGHTDREYQEEDVSVFNATMDMTKAVDRRALHNVEYGLDFQHDNVVSTAFSENIYTLDKSYDILTRYPDGGSGMLTFGAYAKYTWHNPEQFNRFEAGLRFAHTTSDMQYERTDIIDWPSEYTDGVTNKNAALTGSLSWKGRLAPWLRYRLMASTAYRVPNIDDIAKIRARGGDVLVPNLDLTPERSYTFEGTLSHESNELFSDGSSLQVDITGYYTTLTDAIIRSNYQLPNGDTLLDVGGDLYRVQANINAENAWVYGISANLRLALSEHWRIKSSFNHLKGRSEVADSGEQPLAHIPPNYGRSSIEYSDKKWKAEFVVKYNGNKPLDEFAPGSSDNEDFATPDGALAWTTLNIYGSYSFFKYFTLTLAVENIADVHYRMFSSGVSAPGRNFVISLAGRI